MERTLLPDTSLTLLTGATGALGQEVLCQWLETRSAEEHLVVLARGKGKGGAERRVKSILRKRFSGECLLEVERRVTVLDGDLVEEQLGLDATLYNEVATRLAQVIHCAAAVRFDQPLEEARQSNLEGTRRVLELAKFAQKSGQPGRFNYVGTAYIAGKRRGIIYEQEFTHSRGFHNTYEQSKYEAEALVRQAMQDGPVSIYRPSIIIGNSRTGETSNFKAFYWPIRAYALGQMKVLPGLASCRIDLVPVDYVASAVIHLSNQAEAIGGCYHLTAGRENLTELGEIVAAAVDFFKIKRPYIIHPAFLRLAEGWPGRLLLNDRALKTLKLGEPYYPYFATNLEYDTRQAFAVLEPAGICAPPVRNFFERLFRYCLETDWGRHAPDPAKATRPVADIDKEEHQDIDLVRSF
jgi:thioester reductase-like protein